MKLNLRFLYLLPLLAVLFTDHGLNEFAFGNEDVRPTEQLYVYGLAGLGLLAALAYRRHMQPLVRTWFWLTVACIGLLAMESYSGWGVWMKYPHVFSKLSMLLPLFGLYAYYRSHPGPSLRQLVVVLFPGLLISLAVYHPEALSLGSFLDTERGFSVTSTYLLLPIALLCLNWYLTWGEVLSGLAFLFAMALIVFLQHRTVWVCTSLALAINIGLVAWRVPQARQLARRLTTLGVAAALLGVGSGLAVVLDNPDVVNKFVNNLEDLQHPTTQGTGTFRVHQYEAYMPFVYERPVAGWRLEGFELPVQLYGEDGQPVWKNYTGHHFHSFYLDRLFYGGGLGLLLVVLVPLLALLRILFRTTPLTPDLTALVSYSCTFFVFGLSYDWPSYVYGVLGMVLAAISFQMAPATPSALGRSSRAPQRHRPTIGKSVLTGQGLT
jgi:O-antigen ligase